MLFLLSVSGGKSSFEQFQSPQYGHGACWMMPLVLTQIWP
jgi:hypothetical protein